MAGSRFEEAFSFLLSHGQPPSFMVFQSQTGLVMVAVAAAAAATACKWDHDFYFPQCHRRCSYRLELFYFPLSEQYNLNITFWIEN